ncbi:NAD(P)H-hydrate epimerase [Mangrovicoccus sp. HB161399]|uniref:NAD(P)H-hydrate epimerase n=1 Tax=Mangrovicoccus sp. HB161399 TaxID=2720392 RepID=UPI00352DD62D
MKSRESKGSQEVLSAEAMRHLEEAAFAGGRISSREAMERAGQGVAAGILARHPQPGRVLVLCGPGNNGGDGYVVARILHGRGWTVRVAALGRPEAAGPDAAANRHLWEARGGIARLPDPLEDGAADVLVDALFGIGLSRGISGELGAQLEEIAADAAAAGTLRVAVDLPSGLDADSGAALGTVLPADLTVTFHCRKPVHGLRPDLCGEVKVVDIGL